MNTYLIQLNADAGQGPFGPLPALSESFTVTAADQHGAFKAAQKQMSLRLSGQRLHVLIDGVEYFDPSI
ncbi:hypothetical protein [Hymenobacter guriensis]|uniref:Uncharacterized protein n=1 Tax=Hymenobacter guriensis TaxID=2793065 RepID=A0ABS0KWV9_9BACT|nr:hypothetical protein [Hymenobacter guriensis]MBG8552318.1 hypothetical protein [Hymenobacter guriensis]